MSRTPHCWYVIKVFLKEHIHRPRISALRVICCYCSEEPSQLITTFILLSDSLLSFLYLRRFWVRSTNLVSFNVRHQLLIQTAADFPSTKLKEHRLVECFIKLLPPRHTEAITFKISNYNYVIILVGSNYLSITVLELPVIHLSLPQEYWD